MREEQAAAVSGQRVEVTGNVLSATSPVPSQMRSLSGPIVHSACRQRFCAKLTLAETRALFAEDRARPPQPWSAWQALRAGWWRCSVCRGLTLRLQSAALRSALHWPTLEALLPSVRTHAQRAAMLDRVSVESGGVLSASGLAAAVRRLKSYREEWDQLVVWRQPASAGTQVKEAGRA